MAALPPLGYGVALMGCCTYMCAYMRLFGWGVSWLIDGQGRAGGAAVGLVLDRGLFMGVPQVRRRMCALCLVCGTVQGSPLAAGGALLWRRTTNGTTGPHYTVCLLLL